MKESTDAVYLYIPLMKELSMSWSEIKKTPRRELEGLLLAFGTFNTIHSFDGYSSKDVAELAKEKPSIRSDYSKSLELKARMERKINKTASPTSFQGII